MAPRFDIAHSFMGKPRDSSKLNLLKNMVALDEDDLSVNSRFISHAAVRSEIQLAHNKPPEAPSAQPADERIAPNTDLAKAMSVVKSWRDCYSNKSESNSKPPLVMVRPDSTKSIASHEASQTARGPIIRDFNSLLQKTDSKRQVLKKTGSCPELSLPDGLKKKLDTSIGRISARLSSSHSSLDIGEDLSTSSEEKLLPFSIVQSQDDPFEGDAIGSRLPRAQLNYFSRSCGALDLTEDVLFDAVSDEKPVSTRLERHESEGNLMKGTTRRPTQGSRQRTQRGVQMCCNSSRSSTSKGSSQLRETLSLEGNKIIIKGSSRTKYQKRSSSRPRSRSRSRSGGNSSRTLISDQHKEGYDDARGDTKNGASTKRQEMKRGSSKHSKMRRNLRGFTRQRSMSSRNVAGETKARKGHDTPSRSVRKVSVSKGARKALIEAQIISEKQLKQLEEAGFEMRKSRSKKQSKCPPQA